MVFNYGALVILKGYLNAINIRRLLVEKPLLSRWEYGLELFD